MTGRSGRVALLLSVAAVSALLAGCSASRAEPPDATAAPASPSPQIASTQAQNAAPATVRVTPALTASPRSTAPPTLPPTTAPKIVPGGSPAPESGHGLEEQARTDLAARLGLPPERVRIVSADEMEMPADSLGCGSEKDGKAPGILLGREIVLDAEGRQYTYRSDGRRLLPCTPDPFPGGTTPLLATGSRLLQLSATNLAINDLVRRTNVAKSTVTVEAAEAVEWSDASLGCPQPGMMYAQVITPGYRIVLRAAGRVYEYHTGGALAILCDKP